MTNKVSIKKGSASAWDQKYEVTIHFSGGSVTGDIDEWALKQILGVTKKMEEFDKCEHNKKMVEELKLFCYRWGDEFE
jgi:hypothetical protein